MKNSLCSVSGGKWQGAIRAIYGIPRRELRTHNVPGLRPLSSWWKAILSSSPNVWNLEVKKSSVPGSYGKYIWFFARIFFSILLRKCTSSLVSSCIVCNFDSYVWRLWCGERNSSVVSCCLDTVQWTRVCRLRRRHFYFLQRVETLSVEYRETQAGSYGKHVLGVPGNTCSELRETQATQET